MDDEKYQERVEHQRLSDKFEDLQDRVRELEITLHGKRSKTGLLAEYERHDALLGRLYAVIWQDPTGQKGILHDIDILMGRREEKIKAAQYKWQFWGLILTAMISSGTALILSWDKILKILPKYNPSPLEKKIDQAKHPKGKKIYRLRVVPAKPASESLTPETETPQQ